MWGRQVLSRMGRSVVWCEAGRCIVGKVELAGVRLGGTSVEGLTGIGWGWVGEWVGKCGIG